MLRCVTQNTWEITICINFTMLNEFKRPALELKRRTHKMSGWMSFTLYFIEVVAELSLSMDVVCVINRGTVKFNYSQIWLPNHSSMFGWLKKRQDREKFLHFWETKRVWDTTQELLFAVSLCLTFVGVSITRDFCSFRYVFNFLGKEFLKETSGAPQWVFNRWVRKVNFKNCPRASWSLSGHWAH